MTLDNTAKVADIIAVLQENLGLNTKADFVNLIGGTASIEDTQLELAIKLNAMLDSLVALGNAAESNNSTIKSDIITKLNTKGLTLAGGATWADIQAGIPNITLGKKFAQGVGTTGAWVPFTVSIDGGSTYTTNNVCPASVSGLSFTPKTILISGLQDTNNVFMAIYSAQSQFYLRGYLSPVATYITTLRSSPVGYGYLTGNAIVDSSGFTLPIMNSNLSAQAFNWIAFE